jgi:hypothetical protein
MTCLIFWGKKYGESISPRSWRGTPGISKGKNCPKPEGAPNPTKTRQKQQGAPRTMSSAPLHELVAAAVASNEDDVAREHHAGSGQRIESGANGENRVAPEGLSPSRASALLPSAVLNMSSHSANLLESHRASMFLPGMGSFPSATAAEESARNAILTRACGTLTRFNSLTGPLCVQKLYFEASLTHTCTVIYVSL